MRVLLPRLLRVVPLVVIAVLLGGGCKKPKHEEWPASMQVVGATQTAEMVRRAKGDVVLLVLYASWCKGCRTELPKVDVLRARYAPRGLKVLAFSLDEDPLDYGEMLDEKPLKLDLWRVAPIDNPALIEAVRGLGGSYAQSIPYSALFDRDGKLVAEWTEDDPVAQIESKVKTLL